jgi:hypothetical protein
MRHAVQVISLKNCAPIYDRPEGKELETKKYWLLFCRRSLYPVPPGSGIDGKSNGWVESLN